MSADVGDDEIEGECGDEGETPAAPNSLTQDPESGVDPNEYRTLAHGHLSPRHRRLAFLAAQGKSNAEICTELGYVASRVSILLKNHFIAEEISRLQERIFEETIGARLKSFAEPALANIQAILTDRTNRVKVSEKMALSQWVIEKLDGKATQKIEAGENLLASLMDRLDAGRTRPVVNITNNITQVAGPDALDVTPDEPKQIAQTTASEDELESWIADFDVSSSKE